MRSIGEGCDSLGKTSLTSLVSNHWTTGGLWVNSSSVKRGLISFPLFLLQENAILPMTPQAGCGSQDFFFLSKKYSIKKYTLLCFLTSFVQKVEEVPKKISEDQVS